MPEVQPSGARRRRRGPRQALVGVALATGVFLGACGGPAAGEVTGHVFLVVGGVEYHRVPSGGTVEAVHGSTVVARERVAPGAAFHLTVPAGTYRLKVVGDRNCEGAASVRAGGRTSVDVTCDSSLSELG